jgi:6,7-dimethyl-8-ribityllumazine synthase
MILILQSLWNQSLTDNLALAAREEVSRAGFDSELIQVPGALELPLALEWAITARGKNKIEGAVACGVVIKGDTYHFELVANDSSRGLMEVSLKHQIPVGHAVLATYSLSQAQERARGEKNKGIEAAKAVLQMLELKKRMS